MNNAKISSQKILMVTNDFLPNPGGVANHIFELSKSLYKLGHKIKVLHFCYTKIDPEKDIIEGVEVERIFLNKNSANKQDIFSKINRYFSTIILGSKAINKIIKNFAPDIIHWHDYYHTSLAMKLVNFKGKKVLTNHASGYLEQYDKAGIYKYYLKFLASRADLIIAPSEELANKSKILNKKVFYIPNGVDSEKFIEVNNKDLFKLKFTDSQNFFLVAPRRLDPKNGLDYLIKAIAVVKKQIPNIFLLIAGGGSEEIKTEYLNLINFLELQENVFITGNLPYKDMPKVIGSADLVIMPSLMEAVSLAALEALSCGVPVIASNVGGLPAIIDNTVGDLVKPADPESLANGIIKNLTLSSKDLEKKQTNARERVLQKYTWKHTAYNTEKLYCA